MPSKGFKPILTVAFLMAICLVKLAVCKSIDDGFEIEASNEAIESKSARRENLNQGQRNSKPISDAEFAIGPLDVAMESKRAKGEQPNDTQKHSKGLLDNEFKIEPVNESLMSKSLSRVENTIKGQRHSKRVSESLNQIILNSCFREGLGETVKALGVLDLPGVRLVNVEGELYEKLLKNRTVVESRSVASVSRDQSVTKRSSNDMCEEDFAYTYVLAHANGQIAYQVDTVVCQGIFCQSPTLKSLVGGEFGDCVLKENKMIVYVMDTYGNFIPQTINIGCACECMAYY